MSDHGSDDFLQTDLHLKPLDNSALLKPLRKPAEDSYSAPAEPAQSSPEPPQVEAPAVIPPQEPAPVSSDAQPVVPDFLPADSSDTQEDIDDIFDDDDDSFDDDNVDDDEDFDDDDEPFYDDVKEDFDDDSDTAEPPAPPAAPEPISPAPAKPIAEKVIAAPAAQSTPASQEKPAAPSAEHTKDFKPTNEQVQMMELMKSIFANALSTSKPDTAPSSGSPGDQLTMDDLRSKLISMQQKIREAKIPVVIVFEGLSASGKGTMLSRLIEGLDARGLCAHPIREPNCVETQYPPMWRYWTKMPARGNISLFCSSWYGELNKTSALDDTDTISLLPKRLDEIICMETQLACDGVLILKFFLNISQEEQFDRLKKLEQKKSTKWLVDSHDREQNQRYDEFMKNMNNIMSITNLKGSPWHVIDANDLKLCTRQIYFTVIKAFGRALSLHEKKMRPWDVPMLPNLSAIPSLGYPPLQSIDLNRHLDKDYHDELKDAKKRLAKLQIKLYRRKIPMVIAFEGWDAAGKGGAIRRLNAALDARGFTVVPISAPTPLELSHHYLWRFWSSLPQKGHIAIFDRTWYGRVMVERIEGLCTTPQWQRAYDEINRFEKLLTDDGAILCKFWLQIDKPTQLNRFEERKNDPEKAWKLTDDDWRNREKWDQYEMAVDEVLQRTHTACAPWTVVESNDKEYARIKVLHTVIDAIEQRLKDDKKRKDDKDDQSKDDD